MRAALALLALCACADRPVDRRTLYACVADRVLVPAATIERSGNGVVRFSPPDWIGAQNELGEGSRVRFGGGAWATAVPPENRLLQGSFLVPGRCPGAVAVARGEPPEVRLLADGAVAADLDGDGASERIVVRMRGADPLEVIVSGADGAERYRWPLPWKLKHPDQGP